MGPPRRSDPYDHGSTRRAGASTPATARPNATSRPTTARRSRAPGDGASALPDALSGCSASTAVEQDAERTVAGQLWHDEGCCSRADRCARHMNTTTMTGSGC